MKPKAFLSRMQISPVVQREQERVANAGQDGIGAPKEEYEEGMKVGTLVQNELKHIALME